jgi:hypothetical protein
MALHEDGGRPMGKWREGFAGAGALGELRLDQRYHPVWKRHTKTARFSVPGVMADALPQLDDAEVLFIREGVMRITGIETDELTRKETRQVWHCEVQYTDATAGGPSP